MLDVFFVTPRKEQMRTPNQSDLSNHGVVGLTLADEDYPVLLRTMPKPPGRLYARGDLGLLSKPAVAIVGSRCCSASARTMAYNLARDIASCGWCVVSGLARGVDTAAHQGALASGVQGSTVAVFGTGIDVVYPVQNTKLAHAIVDAGGLWLTAFSPGTRPLPAHFPQRNRIVAGLARATIVVQAKRASGSMITARMAADMGREVLAVPGRATDPLAAGTHDLIRQGAGLLESADDLWAAFGLYHLQGS